MAHTAKGKASEKIIHLDVDDEKLLKSLSIEDEITATVRGTVKAVSAPRKSGEEFDSFPGSLTIVVSKLTIEGRQNVFTALEKSEEV